MANTDFSEVVKLEVKKKAAFRCCRCQNIGVEVHHIIPQEYGGSSNIDNAAPLCPNCHSYFGGNLEKRKEIRQMRDWWYERASKMFPDNSQINRLNAIDEKMDLVINNQISVEVLRKELLNYNQELYAHTNMIIANMTLGTVITSGSAIVNASFSPSASLSASPSPSVSPSASPEPSPLPGPPETEED